ncbi:E3 ISG15--protein ligase HERC5 [Galemys pyrenaicus]|uniref:E3 ISG15--protein ligase HERC5 n=1 Tax=Galemys pyrenaicus TaxID=202257 RepID=A0A8J6A4V7_GALPY|nr:E3 ISG15--protein ligase HERC5 [Galemys pyrenaicus]
MADGSSGGMYFCWREGSDPLKSEGDAGAVCKDLLQAASGERHSLLLHSNGSLFACGDNSRGQLGQKMDVKSWEQPALIQAFKALKIVYVSCGKEHSLAVGHRGKVFAWGAGSEGQLGTGEHGQVFSWGNNDYGQLGLGQELPSQAKPKRVDSLLGIPVTQVAAGGNHSFALSLSGTSFGWGCNRAGQLSLSREKIPVQSPEPLLIPGLKNLHVTYISCGSEHTAVLTQKGKVFTFGDNRYGQLGYSSTAEKRGPQPVKRIDGLVSQIDCGSYHTLAYVYTTGEVVSFGRGPNHTKKPSHPEAPTENSDISCLITPHDLASGQVKHIFAGTYANFVTTYKKCSTGVSKKTLPQINRINQSLIEKWIAAGKTTERKEAESKSGEKLSIDVDLEMARDTFKKLTQNEWVSAQITTVLRENLKTLLCRSPHKEALSVFLLLPECPVMHDSSNWESLVVPFANAVCEMTNQSLLVLEQCWASLQDSCLNTLVQMLKTAMVAQLKNWTGNSWSRCNAKALLGVMKDVYKVNNKTKCPLPENTFHINEFSHFWSFAEVRGIEIVHKEYCPCVFLDFPFVFNLISKIKLLRADFNIWLHMSQAQACLNLMAQGFVALPSLLYFLKVRRSDLVEDALCQLSRADDTDLRKQLVIDFDGEISSSGEGVISEFFHCIFEEMTKVEYGMFIYPEEGSYMWFPVNVKFKKERYYLFGKLCGLSLIYLNVANIPFPLALFKKLLDLKPSLEDLKELSPLLGKSLQEVLNYEADDLGEQFQIYFSIHWDQNDVPLIPDGISITVDQTNKDDYISKCVNYIFDTSVKTIYEEFQRGFYKICQKEILRIFQPEELMTTMVGNTDFDWEQFEKVSDNQTFPSFPKQFLNIPPKNYFLPLFLQNSTYENGYSKSHPTIQMFWEAFHKLTWEEKREFFFFITGNDRLHRRFLLRSGRGGAAVERGKAAMERRSQRGSRSGVRSAPRPPPEAGPAEPRGAQLWLFPSAAGLRRALPRRAEATRQMCCTLGRLLVLKRGGAGVEVHQLPAGRDAARKPKCIKLGKRMKIHSLDQGADHMLILSSDGKPFEYNYSVEHARFHCILQEKIIIQITCGDYHSLALSKGGELFAWGQNLHGQLGVGRKFASMPTPQIVEQLSGVPLVQISAGEAHSMALSMSGNVYSWGRNDFGQLGLGHIDDKDFPSLIECLDNQKVEFLTCGGFHTALLTKDGLVFTFGAGKFGQLGHNSTQNKLRPCLVTELTGKRVTQIACGRWHTLAYVSDLGKVFSFGSGKEGQLGNGGTHNQLVPLPMKLPSNEELKFESHISGKVLVMIAGGNQSILLWMKTENSYVNLKRNIPTLNGGTIKRWIAGGNQRDIFIPCLSDWKFFKGKITTCLKDNLFKNLPFHSPYQEALEVFFLLPECPMMHDSNNWESLVVPFAEAVCKMNEQSSRDLEEYWASLQESAFSKLVQMFKRSIIAQLHYWTESTENNCHIKALLKMLRKLHRVNQTKYQLPENIFKVNELSHWLDFYGEAYRRSSWKRNSETSINIHYPVIFSHFPFIFNFLSKIKLLYADSLLKVQEKKFRACMRLVGIMEQRGSELALLPTLNLTVRRSHLIEDVLNQLYQFENEDLRRELLISFSGEIGHDFGGVKTEFFHCLFEEMTRPEYGMFTYPEDASCMWFPARPKFEKKRYFFFGVLCGLSLFNCNVANIPFPLALFKKLLNQTPSLEDLKELSPVLGKSLQTLLDYEGDDFEEVFFVLFNVHWDKNDVNLIPNESCRIVNQTNKRDYVSKCVNYIFSTSVMAVYEEFQRGFYKVCDKEIIEFFHPEELKDVIIGNTDYDWETFEKNAHYEQGYDNSHPTIVMFWKALHKLTLEEKKKFLVFLTGTDRIQVKGLKNMKITFCCPENLNEKDPIRAQTCFSVLYLPKYSTMERVEEALQVAINNSRGFG